MIELAPNHKYGLPLKVPLMPAAGTFGFGDAYQDLVDLSLLGAVVTNPVSLRLRRAAHGRRIAVHQEAFVVHTGWPNPGLRKVVREHREIWAYLPVPVIVHVLATEPADVARAVGYLSGLPNVGGVELGFSTGISAGRALTFVDAASGSGELPVIAKVPFERLDSLVPRLARHEGVDAVTLMAPPRAVLPVADATPDGPARYIRGRLYGRTLFPLLLNALARWASRLGKSVIACGGIASPEDALGCITLGAAAIQIDALLWRDPSILSTIARRLVAPQPVPSDSELALGNTGSAGTSAGGTPESFPSAPPSVEAATQPQDSEPSDPKETL